MFFYDIEASKSKTQERVSFIIYKTVEESGLEVERETD